MGKRAEVKVVETGGGLDKFADTTLGVGHDEFVSSRGVILDLEGLGKFGHRKNVRDSICIIPDSADTGKLANVGDLFHTGVTVETEGLGSRANVPQVLFVEDHMYSGLAVE